VAQGGWKKMGTIQKKRIGYSDADPLFSRKLYIKQFCRYIPFELSAILRFFLSKTKKIHSDHAIVPL
jgi:hypothetical protein